MGKHGRRLRRLVRARWALAALALSAGCTVGPPALPGAGPGAPAPRKGIIESAGALKTLVLYLPNRVLDLAEIVRAGVNIGPGMGVDLRATRFGQAVAMTRTSVGVGYEGLRHLPVMAAAETAVGLGFLEVPAGVGPTWFKADFDLRAEVHPLLVGAHAAVDAGAIADFFAGIIGIDPSGDDY